MGLLLIAVLGAFPAGASALSSHPFLGSFCEPTGIGSAPCEPSFGIPAGMAVDEATGNVLVIDMEDQTLSRFKPNGEPAPFSALAGNVIDGHPGEEDATPQGEILSTESAAQVQKVQVAVAPPGSGGGTAGDIYVTDTLNRKVDIFESSGKYIGQISFDPLTEEPCGVAVDQSGAVYVGDFFFGVHKFIPSAPGTFGPSSDFEYPGACQVAAGAQPLASGGSEGFVFPVAASGPVAKLDSVTGELDYIVAPGENRAISVDPGTGHPYVASDSAVFEYDVSGPSEAILLSGITPGGERVAGLAADGSGNIFITRIGNPQVEVWGPVELLPKPVTEEPCTVGADSATLCGTVNPEGAPLTECFFEWGETEAYGNVAPCEEPNAAEVGEESSPVPVHADISGLEPGTTYHFQLVAANANGSAEGGDETLFTLGASIKDEAASLVTTTSARLSAKVNPNGEETTYFFQYVSQAQFEAEVNGGYAEAISLPSPPGEAGSGTEFVEVGQQLTGLSPDTTYVFRVVATTPATTHLGADKTFTTRPISANILPDGRAYEMVSPPQKIGEVFPPESSGAWTGSCDDCLPETQGHMPMQARDDGEAVVYQGSAFSAGQASGPNEYLSERGTGGWGTQSLSPLLFASSEEQGYKAFSADLSRAVIYQIEPALTPDAPIGPEGKPYANLYLREQDGTLTPLITEAPPQRAADYENPDRFKIAFAAANAGSALVGPLHHVIFEANDALTEATNLAPAAPTITAEERNLYEWVDGELRLVNVAPGNGAALAGTVFGSGRELTNEIPGSGADFDGAISDDGSRIFFSEKASGQVYVRIDGEETREIQDHLGKFLVASGDGLRVLLSDGCLYDVESEICEDLTQGEGGFLGILGATKDLSRIYFVDTAALALGAEEGEPNLYDWSDGSIEFIATLDEGDNEFNGVLQPQVGDWMPSSSSRTAQVSPDGRFLAFMSRAPLTGYDNHVRGKDECRPNEPAACFEVFEYRADSEDLICVSCNPSGERPLGTANLSLVFRDKNPQALSGFPQPTNLTSNEGRIFFETQDNLTLGDSNGRIKDVYEWEPNGVGSCERPAGCVSLISSGQGPNDSIFLDATASGDDAFFITRDRLLPPDRDEKLDLYDARAPHVPGEAVGFPEAKTAPCQEEACQGPISVPPPAKDPQSGQVSGSGNVHHKHKKKKHHKKHRHHHKHGGHR